MLAIVTTNDMADCELLPDLLEQIDQEIEQVSGDGGYATVAETGALATIPPRTNAQIQQHANCKALPPPT